MIASGGVAGVDDIVRLGEVAGSIEGVIAGRAVYEGALSVQEGVRACDEATRRAEPPPSRRTLVECESNMFGKVSERVLRERDCREGSTKRALGT